MSTVTPDQTSSQSPSSFPSSKGPPPLGQSANKHEAIIRDDLTIEGEFRSKGKLTLSGTIKGEVHCASLVVTEGGKVTGKIVADEVAIFGFVKGEIYGKSVDLFTTSKVEGDIFHHGIGIERGTKYEGTLKYLEDPVATGSSKDKGN